MTNGHISMHFGFLAHLNTLVKSLHVTLDFGVHAGQEKAILGTL